MNCPVCGDRMREIQKYSVELDICPGCRGVWLDRGELEKIIDMVSSGNAPADVSDSNPAIPEARPFEPPRSFQNHDSRGFHDHKGEHDQHKDHDHDHDHDDHKSHDHGYGQHKRRKGWFSELFDD